MDITVRPLTETAEIEELEAIQRATWAMPDIEIIPARMMHALQQQGAVLLGAFVPDEEQPEGRLAGFVFGVLATVEGLTERIDQVAAARLKMYSVIMGVLPEYQSHGIGYQLKLAQREAALRIGVRLITWTFDPLESRNAYLNVSKLGTVCHHYWRNFHGEMGGLNAGLPTDRFHVEWWVTSNRVKSRVKQRRRPLSYDSLIGGGAVLVNEVTFDAAGRPVPPANFDNFTSEILANNILMVEIPHDFQAIKQQAMELAQRWRAYTRHLFEYLFQEKYLVTDFVVQEDEAGRRRCYYLLTHQSA